MAVRPFYINADIKGRKTDLAGGTRNSDGYHDITIYQRDNGSITSPYRIKQFSEYENGVHKLVTTVSFKGEVIHKHVTDY